MTYYKYVQFLMPEDGPEYDTSYKPGVEAPFAGIYYCEACGGSITATRSQPLPSEGIILIRQPRGRSAGAWP
jgi:hypothetical protein